ncbi:unnamed protein product [Schistosoma margrebowiei]|uniref:Uncharacterized protein n=1 Tax=Schistosoma margrebowiei TaxID=48269 RepID=A0A3P8A8A5_9TREM|nr:unnamed protein product [Schistosoma margrebowiei]
MVHTPFVSSGCWSPCASLVWNQGFPIPLDGLCVDHEKAVSRTSLAEAIYTWLYESISRGRADSPYSRPYQGI